MVAGFAPRFRLESFFMALFLRFDLCDMSTVAESSIKNNCHVCCDVHKFLAAASDVQLSVRFSVSDMSASFLDWHAGGF